MTDERNVVLTGFMGTGKTATGREVARQLGRRFVDVDAEIEARAGKPVARIFAEEGEAAFRRLEAQVCADLSRETELVIATGGGALLNPDTRAAMSVSGTVVCLTCEPDEIAARLRSAARLRAAGWSERPLLDVADPEAEIERLLAERSEAYAAIPWQVDTTGRGLADVAAEVMALACAHTLNVSYPGGSYPIHIGPGTLDHLGSALRAAGAPGGSRVAVVSNPVVWPLYGAQAMGALRAASLRPFRCSVPDGEAHKALDTVARLYDQFLGGELERADTVLSLGGGVTGDEAGLAAATYQRGVRFVQVPTTLLAMVDASVGGKTGVDLPQGKNLVGAFKQPALVLIDPSVLSTLPTRHLRAGLAEVLKHGLIGDPELFDRVTSDRFQVTSGLQQAADQPSPLPPFPPSILVRALRVKIDIVERDPYEQGRRMVLNLGHTFGHAIEGVSGYALSHGEAVGVGLVAAARLAARLGICPPELAGQIEAAVAGIGLPTRYPGTSPAEVYEAMAADKKRHHDRLRFVLPRALGDVVVVDDVPPTDVHAVLSEITTAAANTQPRRSRS
ncbi:MAG: 3-dehydroquinate synthase [Anaerolineae bacterium]|nr:3-dehydroquinate synthase [Anaerolineae bacterium]